MNLFKETIQKIYGDQEKIWLQRLPKIVQALSELWDLDDIRPLENSQYHYVASALRRSESVILKIGPENKTIEKEYRALVAFDGHGCVRPLEYSSELGGLLLERIIPGHSLRTYFPHREKEGMEIVCQVIEKLRQSKSPKKGEFLNIQDWLKVLEDSWPFPAEILERGQSLSVKLLSSSPEGVLLHGDLHHDNVLSMGEKWVAIDPHGVVGDPAYEVGAFIRNPLSDLQNHERARSLIQDRIAYFSKALGYPAERILEWSYVQAFLGACWAVQDGGDSDVFLKTILLLG